MFRNRRLYTSRRKREDEREDEIRSIYAVDSGTKTFISPTHILSHPNRPGRNRTDHKLAGYILERNWFRKERYQISDPKHAIESLDRFNANYEDCDDDESIDCFDYIH